MESIREPATERCGGALQCVEEGCKFGYDAIVGSKEAADKASEAHCFLQLRLRAGDPS